MTPDLGGGFLITAAPAVVQGVTVGFELNLQMGVWSTEQLVLSASGVLEDLVRAQLGAESSTLN